MVENCVTSGEDRLFRLIYTPDNRLYVDIGLSKCFSSRTEPFLLGEVRSKIDTVRAEHFGIFSTCTGGAFNTVRAEHSTPYNRNWPYQRGAGQMSALSRTGGKS